MAAPRHLDKLLGELDVEADDAADRELARRCPIAQRLSGACCWLALLAAVLTAVSVVAIVAWAANAAG